MTTLFRNNTTQPSKLQQAIEKVTDGNQPAEDWALIMQICDYVSTHEESAKEAMKIIRKRLHLNPAQHGWRPIVYTLTLLEALTKNCGKIFHVQIAHKDFLKELKSVIGPKNNPPVTIQERVLSIIQTWALAFRNDPDLKTVEHFYQECRQHGLQFPPPEPESSIKTSVTPTPSVERPLRSTRSMPQQGSTGQSRHTSESMSYSSGNNRASSSLQEVSAEQLAKLRSELDVVQTNAQVFGEMLVTLQPGEESPQDYELLTELYNTCKQMQARVVELLSQITMDDITVDLLRYNDEFNNAFISYDKYMQERNRRFTSNKKSPSPTGTSYLTSQSATNKNLSSQRHDDEEPSLIKFDDEPTTSFDKMRITSTVPNVVPRNAPPKPTASTNNPSRTNYHDPESDVKEVEQWLKFQGDESDNDEQTPQEGGTTAAFDSFLQKRASAIPDETVSDRQNNSQAPSKPFQKPNSYF